MTSPRDIPIRVVAKAMEVFDTVAASQKFETSMKMFIAMVEPLYQSKVLDMPGGGKYNIGRVIGAITSIALRSDPEEDENYIYNHNMLYETYKHVFDLPDKVEKMISESKSE